MKSDVIAPEVRFRPPDLQHDLASLRELHGVPDQVEQDLPESEHVSYDEIGHIERKVADELEALAMRPGGERPHRLLDSRAERERRQRKVELTCLDLRKIQQIVDRTEEVLRCRFHGDERPPLPRFHLRVEDQLRHAEDGVHRGPDLVADVGEELVLGAVRRLRDLLRASRRVLGGRELVVSAFEQPRLVDERLVRPLELALLLPPELQLPPELLLLPVEDEEDLRLVAQDHGLDGLVQKIDHARLVSAKEGAAFVRAGRHQDDGHVHRALRPAHQLGELDAVHLRHLHVDDGEREVVYQQGLQGGAAGAYAHELHSFAAENAREREQVLLAVVDQQKLHVRELGRQHPWYHRSVSSEKECSRAVNLRLSCKPNPRKPRRQRDSLKRSRARFWSDRSK